MTKKELKTKTRIMNAKCWAQMSLYTRLKWADSKGLVKCVTCGNIKHYTKINAGHFIHKKLDYDEININPQCVRCNKYLKGNLAEYSMYIYINYGHEALKALHERSKSFKPYTLEELEKLLPELTEKARKVQEI